MQDAGFGFVVRPAPWAHQTAKWRIAFSSRGSDGALIYPLIKCVQLGILYCHGIATESPSGIIHLKHELLIYGKSSQNSYELFKSPKLTSGYIIPVSIMRNISIIDENVFLNLIK